MTFKVEDLEKIFIEEELEYIRQIFEQPSIQYYSTSSEVTAWQGIRNADDNNYLMCGTSGVQGLVNIGPISYNENNTIIFSIPYEKVILTSVYGPNYLDNLNGEYKIQLCGVYRLENNNMYGFFYNGIFNQTSLNNPENYILNLTDGSEFYYLHSTIGNLIVGNSVRNSSEINIGNYAFIYNIETSEYIYLSYPGATTTTVYGIWTNDNTVFTICGGYSNIYVPFDKIYENGQPVPYGYGFVADFNLKNKTFSNWTTIIYPSDDTIVSHFEGISSDGENLYTLSATSQTNTSMIASWVKIKRNPIYFQAVQYLDLKYGSDMTNNSVAGNANVGITHINNEMVPYQAIVS
jgi:hypothetical protein